MYDFSWPPQDSVNENIDPEVFKCFYFSFDDAGAIAIIEWPPCLQNWIGWCIQIYFSQITGLASIGIILGPPAP